MDDSSDSQASEFKSESHQPSKRRKVVEKTVVTVKIGENGGKVKNESAPSDSWSWRKYGQKPIKGSPYPRGYYRCSTSKGCSAKKQVERCRTDASLLIITYTSSHNHPDPHIPNSDPTREPNPKDEQDQPASTSPKQESNENQSQETTDQIGQKDSNFHYIKFPQDEMINQDVVDHFSAEKPDEGLGILLDEEPLSCCSRLMEFSTTKSEDSDVYDELEELPTHSAFTSFSFYNGFNFYNERIPAVPS